MGGFTRFLDRYFHITERGSTVGTELKAGACSFMTMSYILLVNGQILGAGGLAVKSVVAATALSSCVASLAVGLLANVPFGISPGMGLNAFLVFSQVLGLGVTPESALAGCMVAALIVGALASCNALSVVLSLVPDAIKLATVVGMGLLLSFIGLQTAKVVVPDAETMVTLGDLGGSVEPVLAAGGLALIAALHYRGVRGSIIVGILGTALAYYCAVGGWPTRFVALPQLRRIDLDYAMLLGRSGGGAAAAGAGGGGGGGLAVGGGGGGGLAGGGGGSLLDSGSGGPNPAASFWAAGAAGAAAFRAITSSSAPALLGPRRMLMMTAPTQQEQQQQQQQQQHLATAAPPPPAPLSLAAAASRATAERVRLSRPPGSSIHDQVFVQRHRHSGSSSGSGGAGGGASSPSSPSPPGDDPAPKPGGGGAGGGKAHKASTASRATAWSAVCAYSLVMIFDIGGAMFGLGSLAGLVRQRPDGHGGELPGATWVFLAACLGTALGAATGTTPLIIAAESAVGIKEGGRTGLVAVVISLCFAASCFLAPLLQAIPQVATAPVLVLVGAMMMGESVHIDWGSMPTAVPAFLTIVVQPFTFSIANGIYAGVLMSAALFVLTGGLAAALFGRGGGGGGDSELGGEEGLGAEAAAAAAAAGLDEAGLDHPHASLPFEEPLLTNTYDGGHPSPHHGGDAAAAWTPTPYKAAPPPPDVGAAAAAAAAAAATTAPRPIGRNGHAAPTSDGGSDAGAPTLVGGRGGLGSSSLRARGGSGGGSAAAAVVGSLSRIASSLTRPPQYERASFTMLTNTAPAGGSGTPVSTSQQQQRHLQQQQSQQQRQP